MGDGNLQQLIIVGLFVLFTLLEAVGRVIKKRSKGSSTESEPTEYTVEDRDFEIFDRPTTRAPEREPERWRQEPVVERQVPAPSPAPSPRAAPERAAPQRAPAPRVSAPRAAQVRAAPVRVQSARKASAGMTALDRLDTSRTGRATDREPLLNADDARRAILAMTILGPCRAFEPHSDPSASR